MATVYSDQVTKYDQSSPSKKIQKNEHSGGTKIWFSYTTPAGAGPAVADVIQLCKIPDNARVIGGVAWAEAMSTGAGTAGFDIGITGATQRYGAAKNVDAAARVTFADSIAENVGDVISGETYLLATVTGEAWAVSKKFYGYVNVLLP